MKKAGVRIRRKQERPGELLAAALDVFVTRGFKAARVEEIARAAGVSKATVFLYFPTKEALFMAVVREAILPRIALAETMVADGRDAPARLLPALLKLLWQALGEERLAGIPKLIFAEAGNFPDVAAFYFEHVVAPCRAVLIEVLTRGMDMGVFRKGDVKALTHLAVAPLLFHCMWQESMAKCDPDAPEAEAFFQSYLDNYLRGLLVSSPPVMDSQEMEFS